MNSKFQQYVRTFPRFTGFLAFVICSVIFYHTMVAPILNAQPGVGIVRLNGKYGSASFFLAAISLLLMFVGHRITPITVSAPPKSKTPIFLAGAVFAIISIFLVESFKSYLRVKGYVVQ